MLKITSTLAALIVVTPILFSRCFRACAALPDCEMDRHAIEQSLGELVDAQGRFMVDRGRYGTIEELEAVDVGWRAHATLLALADSTYLAESVYPMAPDKRCVVAVGDLAADSLESGVPRCDPVETRWGWRALLSR